MSEQEFEAVKAYIRANCTPDDIFTRDELVEWIAENEEPEDVFPRRKLKDLAREPYFEI